MLTAATFVSPAAAAPPTAPVADGSQYDKPAAPVPDASGMSVDQAIVQAHAAGRPVEATGAATATDTMTANPDGTVTLTRTAVPTRAKVGGSWRNLDATLVRNADGSLSPAVSEGGLRLSGGGTGPMAELTGGGLRASIDAPVRLPVPTISGPTATYAGVMPGVDLQVTAAAVGGFSEVFVVRTAAAAANPALRTLLLPARTSGLTISADAIGNLTGRDRLGRAVLSAPAPRMWDSAISDGTDTGRQNGIAGRQVASSSRGPGAHARIAPVKAAYRSGQLQLTPDTKLLVGSATAYPVYIDPTFIWSAVGATNNGWATVAADFPQHNYWKSTPDPLGRMQVGDPGTIWSHTLINFPIPTSVLSGAVINTAQLKITETRSYSCTPSRVNLYAPTSATLSSANATWAWWDGQDLGKAVAQRDFAHGYDNCPAAAETFDVKSVISHLPAGKKTQTFVLTGSDETNDRNSWKEFLETSPSLSITYDHAPNQPQKLTTSPATSCGAATPTVVGDGQVTLYAQVSDNDGGVLGTTFNLWKSSAPGTILASSNPSPLTTSSSSTAVLRVPVATLRQAAGNAVTEFSWRVQVTDFNLTSSWSATCRFRYDNTRTGSPTVVPPDEGTVVIGDSVDIPISPPTSGSIPTSYLYQVNGGPYGTVNADSTGAAVVTVLPSRYTNSVTVNGLTVGGNVGDTATVTFNAQPVATGADGDFNGDGLTDLVVAGGDHDLASGLWLTEGTGSGRLGPAATNIGARGNGAFYTGKATDFDGAQLLAGHFAGSGLEDVLAYYPTGSAHAGLTVILRGNGDGSPIQTQFDGTWNRVNETAFVDDNSLVPSRLVSAGPHTNANFPDLLGISGDDDLGYYLDYFPNAGVLGGYGLSYGLNQTTPTGGTDWNTWTIASTQTSTGTWMFLWQPSTGLLYLWRGLAYDDTTGALTFQQSRLSNTWNTGLTATLQAGDLDGDGAADLWAVADDATATAWLVSGLDQNSPVLTAQPAGRILTSRHAWLLNDATDGPVNGTQAAADSTGALPMTGSGQAQWNSGDLYDPDVRLDGTSSALATSGSAVSSTGDFTISVWVKPTSTAGTVVSEDGANIAAFKLYAEPSDGSWRFAMPAKDQTDAPWVVATGRPGSVKVGAWAHLNASFTASTGTLDLHVNGVDVGTAVQPTAWNYARGVFRVGAARTSATAVGAYLGGQIAEVLTFDQVVIADTGNAAFRDFDGDRKPDIFANRSGTDQLTLYRGNGAGSFRYFGHGAVIGSGWNVFNALMSVGDVNGDGFVDVMGRRSNGELDVYLGNGAGSWITSHSVPIGSDWDIYSQLIAPGDFNGDGRPDLIGRKSTGELYLYAGTGTAPYLAGHGVLIRGGFSGYNTIVAPGDFTGDGHPDLIARTPSGDLYLYAGTGTGGLSGSASKVGVSFDAYSLLVSTGDFSGDGHPDLLGMKSTGELVMYTGSGFGGWSSGRGRQIGTGWQNFNLIF